MFILLKNSLPLTFLEPGEALRQRADRLLGHRVHQPVGEALLQGGTREQVSHKVAQRHRSVVDAVGDDGRRRGRGRRRRVVLVHLLVILQLKLLLTTALRRALTNGRLTVHALHVLQLDLERVPGPVQVLQVLRRTKAPTEKH